MVTLAFLLAAFLDPVQAALVLAILLIYRGPQAVLVAAAVAAAASETAIMLASFDYVWGELIAPRFAASLMQAALLSWIVGSIRPGRAGPHAQWSLRRLASHVIAAIGVGLEAAAGVLASRAARFSVQRLAPWHMRAYVKRRLMRLRSR